MLQMEEAPPEMELPGFRFHPTEEELVDFYLRSMLHGKKLRYDAIRFLNIYRHDPSELPRLASQGEREWYFYVPRDQKHGSSRGRPNRTTEKGYWKATGSDRKITSLTGHKRLIGLRKTLVFYQGRAPLGIKTNWVMNEYRVPDNPGSPKDMVLCKIYQKAISLTVLEQRAAVEEAIKISNQSSSSLSLLLPPVSPLEATPAYTPLETTSANTWPHDVTLPLEATPAYTPLEATPADTPIETTSAYTWPHDVTLPASDYNKVVLKLEENKEEVFQIQTEEIGGPSSSSSRVSLQFWRESLPELQVPRFPVADWTQDAFWTQFNSPWLLNLITTPHEHLELLG